MRSITKYITPDGQEFEDRDEAEKHEHICYKLESIDEFIMAKQMNAEASYSPGAKARMRNLIIEWEEYRFNYLGADDDKATAAKTEKTNGK